MTILSLHYVQVSAVACRSHDRSIAQTETIHTSSTSSESSSGQSSEDHSAAESSAPESSDNQSDRDNEEPKEAAMGETSDNLEQVANATDQVVESEFTEASTRPPNPWAQVTKENLQDWLNISCPAYAHCTIGWQENRFVFRTSIKPSPTMHSSLLPQNKRWAWPQRGAIEALEAALHFAWERHIALNSGERPEETLPSNWPNTVRSFLGNMPIVKAYYSKHAMPAQS